MLDAIPILLLRRNDGLVTDFALVATRCRFIFISSKVDNSRLWFVLVFLLISSEWS